ncbi:MAG TPA: tRNA lysidine(34) synthetase TilS, partial [Candidatus Caccousia stercoris]|nr:tRNA lysidine(34) synthetase TilS [Candidatus Caccousia stercoris]
NPGNYDTIQNDMVVRTRLPGDRFRPAGRGVTKPLRRLLAEDGVPPAARDRRILLAESGGEIRWAEGLGPCEAWDARGCMAGVFLVEIEK